MACIKCMLLDIEGTVCPISFVKNTLFPYAIKALPDVLERQWDSEELKQYRNAFPEEHRRTPTALQAHVEDLTERDVKVAYLKNLQGYLWKDGYETGAYATDLFPDVVPQLRKWKADGAILAIYSSGSVYAQKLLFGHVQAGLHRASKKRQRTEVAEELEVKVEEPPAKKLAVADGPVSDTPNEATSSEAPKASSGTENTVTAPDDGSDGLAPPIEDLTALFQDWFDTTNAGLKTESSSYTKIAETLEIDSPAILFLSDNVKEVDAAITAGMKSILVNRPGNAPVTESDKARLEVVESLGDIEVVVAGAEGVDSVPTKTKGQ